MNTDLTWQIVSTGSESTMQAAAVIGSRLRGGEVIELISDLGGGKTTFVRGLVRGMGSSDDVASPSFTISREYQAGNILIEHYDFYRLDDPGLIASELREAVHDPRKITVIEWADIVVPVLPDKRIIIRLDATGEDNRLIAISCASSLAYIKEESDK